MKVQAHPGLSRLDRKGLMLFRSNADYKLFAVAAVCDRFRYYLSGLLHIFYYPCNNLADAF